MTAKTLACLCVSISLPLLTASTFFDLDEVPPAFLDSGEAPWNFESIVDLPISVEDCWSIITSDDAWQFWHPEVSIVEGVVNGVGGMRTIEFDDWLFSLFAFGPVQFEETFDVWKDTGDVREYAFYFSASTRPEWFAYYAGREEFICESINGGSRFTRRVAFDPGPVAQSLSLIAVPRLKLIFEVNCPKRLLNSIYRGDLPT